MTASLERLDLDLPGLLELLGGSLYSDPRVAYRELIQNAHDACTRRRVAAAADDRGWRPRIEVDFPSEGPRRLVRIQDNGEGLEPDEIRRFLATIGRGRTREVRRLLEASGDEDADELVGQFGVGLLAAFLVADRVEVTTQGRGVAAHRWICEGRQTYRIEAAERDEQGTTVQLRIREDHEELGLPAIVRDAVHHYARYLEHPIFVAGERINARALPWRCDDERASLSHEELAATWSSAGRPIFVLPLRPFTHPRFGEVALHGVLSVPEASVVSLGELGEVAVLIRHMLVTARDRDLLPPWARFVDGLVDCPLLQPTASREQLRRDERMELVREAIGAQLLAGLGALQRERPAVWRQLVDGHRALLKQWSARHRALFDAIADHVPFATTRGEMTLPEYLEAAGEPVIYYFSEEQEARTMALLLEATARPVVDAQWFGDLPFLRVYARCFGLRLVRELEAEAGVITAVERPSDGLRRVAARLATDELDVQVARFDPRSLPAFVQTPSRLEVQREVRGAAGRGQLHAALAALTSDYLEREAPRQARRRLFLNVSCPLVQMLGEASAAGSRRVDAAIDLVGAMARTLSGERLSPARMLEIIAELTSALEQLLGAQAPVAARPLSARWAMEQAGLSRAKAESLRARYGSLEALAAADPATLAEQLGISRTIGEALTRLAAHAEETT